MNHPMPWKEFLQRALSEDSGNPSSTRLNLFLAVIALVPAVTFTLVYVVLTQKDLIVSTLASVLAFLASLYGMKQWGKGKEADVPVAPPAEGTEP